MSHDPRILLTPTISDSRLRGYFVRRDDMGGAGLTQMFCSNCGKPAGAVRFDDPRATLAEVVCDPCVKRFGKPPMKELK